MGRSPDPFRPEALLPFLAALACRGRLLVAFSGGGDSTALLLALQSLRGHLDAPLGALHANHGVHPDADRWAEHCRSLCARLGVPLEIIGPPADGLPPGSPEARLRDWRYGAFTERLRPGDVVCTAHHLEDQAETLLLALLRGSGPAGLAAMPRWRDLGPGRLARPLLDTPRAALLAWLRSQDEAWIEDPSNEDPGPDRNYLRRDVLPLLRARWPAADRTLATSASLCAEAALLVDDAAALALAGRRPRPDVLFIDGLTQEPAALRAVLRHWLSDLGCAPLPREQLTTLVTQLAEAAPDGAIRMAWSGHDLRHHRGRLWLDSAEAPPCPGLDAWDGHGAAQLGQAGELRLEPALSLTQTYITARAGGERFRSRPDGPSRSLKQWLSGLPLPPWLRPAVPLVFEGERLLAAGDIALDGAFSRRLREEGATLCWKPVDPALQWAWDECRVSAQQVK